MCILYIFINVLHTCVYDKKLQTWYWGALCKIQQNKHCEMDKLYNKRIITIQFGCNGRISNSRFKGTLENYGYNKHGRAAFNQAILRNNHLLQDSKVVITIHFRDTCRCNHKQISTHTYHQQCEIHSKKTSQIVTKRQNTLDLYLKQ